MCGRLVYLYLCTWQCGVGLSSFGSDAVVPSCVGVVDKSAQVMKQLWEGHVAGLVDGVVEQGCAPQDGVLAEEYAVDACQTLLSRVDRPQTVFLPATDVAPWLMTVVDATEIVRTWTKEEEDWFTLPIKLAQTVYDYSLPTEITWNVLTKFWVSFSALWTFK